MIQGHAGKSRPLQERAFALQEWLESDFDRRLRLPGSYGMTLNMCGRHREGMALHEQAIARALENKQLAGLTFTHMQRCISLWVCADAAAHLPSVEQAHDYAEKNGERILYV